jgi:hypothetical protein
MLVQNKTMDNPFIGWTTIQDAAEKIGRDPTVVRYWANQGYITAYTIGKNTRIVRLEEVIEYARRLNESNNGKV